MKTVGETLKLSAQFLETHHIDRARRESEELLAHILGVKRIDLYMQFDRPLQEEELAPLRGLLKRKIKGEPVEYLTGSVDFCGCKIQVNRSVLIPRQETEILVDQLIEKFSARENLVVWDICTGSGCIAVALKKGLPHACVIASDLSPEALTIARENARLNGVNIEFRQGDLLIPFAGERADVVVCNPPYVSLAEYATLASCVADHEPRLALVGGERGTEFYERLSKELPPYLHAGSQVFLEIGTGQGEALKKIFSNPLWARRELSLDWSGHDRFFFLEMQ